MKDDILNNVSYLLTHSRHSKLNKPNSDKENSVLIWYNKTNNVYLYCKSIIMNKTPPPGKYKDIFKTGKELFWKYGIKRVTIEEICKEAGVSKMTFYKFFPNKIEFAKIILEVEIGESLKKFEQVVYGDLSFPEKVKQMFVLKLEGAKDISLEFISDIYKNPEMGLQQVIEKQKQKSLGLFVDFLTESQKKGLIRKEIKIDFILYYSRQMLQMFDDKQLVSKYDHPHDLIMEAMNFLFYGLLPQK